LPPSTLACPPSATYIRQFQLNAGAQGASSASTVPTHSQRPATTDGAKGEFSNRDVVTRAVPNTAAGADRKNGVIQPRDAEVWVKKWVDYSTKYGLGYYLSNEATGVFFNDSTKIVLDPNGHHLDYMERRSSDRQDVGTEYTLTEYPKEL
jgi:polo-like kinase 1